MAKLKKSFWYLLIAIILIFLIGVLIYLLLFKIKKREPVSPPPVFLKEKSLEEILKDLTAPERQMTEAEKKALEKVRQNATASKKEVPEVPAEILENLTAPK